jgi:hypothetical protein
LKQVLGFFDEIRIINLPERTDRRRAVESELAALGLQELPGNMRFFDALRPPARTAGEQGPNGALISHRELIREVLRTDAQSLLILEDDIFFRRPGDAAVNRILDAMRRTDWDVIYLGYLEPSESDLGAEPLAEWRGRVIGGHFCGMRRPFMERILAFMDAFGVPDAEGNILNPTHRDGAFNLFVERHPDVRRILANPCLAGQRSSRTDLHALGLVDRLPVLRDIASLLRDIRNRLRTR